MPSVCDNNNYRSYQQTLVKMLHQQYVRLCVDIIFLFASAFDRWWSQHVILKQKTLTILLYLVNNYFIKNCDTCLNPCSARHTSTARTIAQKVQLQKECAGKAIYTFKILYLFGHFVTATADRQLLQCSDARDVYSIYIMLCWLVRCTRNYRLSFRRQKQSTGWLQSFKRLDSWEGFAGCFVWLYDTKMFRFLQRRTTADVTNYELLNYI